MTRTPDRTPYPVYSNQQTFLRCASGSVEEVRDGTLAVVGIPQDTTAASRPGARWGPASIRAASAGFDYFMRSTLVDELVDVETARAYSYKADDSLIDLGDLMTYPLDLARTVDSVSSAVAAIVDRGGIPIALGGDHFVSYPVCRGVLQSYRARSSSYQLGYIHIDGDLDISDDNRTWGRLFHGTNARRIAEMPGIDTNRMVMYGISGVTRRDQWDFVHQQGITMLTADDIDRIGAANAMSQAIEIAGRGADGVYVTCDIDVIQGMEAPGTGAIKLSGITGADLLSAAAVLSEVPNLVGLDIVEVAPEWDSSGRTPALAASYLVEVLMPRLYDISTAPRSVPSGTP